MRIAKEFRDGLGSAGSLLSALRDAGPYMSRLPLNVHIEKRKAVTRLLRSTREEGSLDISGIVLR